MFLYVTRHVEPEREREVSIDFFLQHCNHVKSVPHCIKTKYIRKFLETRPVRKKTVTSMVNS